MRRGFEALDACLQVRESFFERAHAAVKLSVRELDHRLRFGGNTLGLFFEGRSLAGNLFSRMRNTFSDQPDLVPGGFERDVEMPASLGVGRNVLLAQNAASLGMGRSVLLAQNAASLGVLLTQKAASLGMGCGVFLAQNAASLGVGRGVLHAENFEEALQLIIRHRPSLYLSEVSYTR